MSIFFIIPHVMFLIFNIFFIFIINLTHVPNEKCGCKCVFYVLWFWDKHVFCVHFSIKFMVHNNNLLTIFVSPKMNTKCCWPFLLVQKRITKFSYLFHYLKNWPFCWPFCEVKNDHNIFLSFAAQESEK